MGTISDLINLWNFITGQKPKIEIESFEYHPGGYNLATSHGSKVIGSKILLKNKSNKSTTIEKIYADLGNYLLEPELHSDGHSSKPIDILPNSSKMLKFESWMSEEEFDRLKIKDNLEFTIHINHTFGKIHKSKTVN